MNTRIFTSAKRCTKNPVGVLGIIMMAVVWLAVPAQADWSVDFSRRIHKSNENDLNRAAEPAANDRQPASANPAHAVTGASEAGDAPDPKQKGLFDTIFDAGEPVQDVVILHTDHGFVPSTVRVRKNGRYKIHVVNVNDKEKNVSFILDGFSEHHATYYGKIKTFMLEPKKEGTYSFQSPETSSEGKLIVFNPQMALRAPASEDSK